MASERERWISYLDLYLHAKNRPTDGLDLPEALRCLAGMKVAGTKRAMIRDPRWILQLSDMNVDDRRKVAVLLFLGIDRQRAEAVYGDIDTLNLRTAKKNPNEGGTVAAHLVINIDGRAPQTCLSLLEDVDGMSRSRIVPFLRKLIDDNIDHTEKMPNGDDKTLQSNLTASIVADRPIQDQLNDARLLAVDLVKKTRKNEIDKKDEYGERIRLIEFKPVSDARGTKARRIISAILGRSDVAIYPEVRIQIEESDGNQRSVNVNRERQDALTSAFQRRTLIEGLDPPLQEATKTIVDNLVTKMVALLKAG